MKAGIDARPGGAWLRLVRPKQWLKNLLVFAAPGAAGALLSFEVLVDALAAFAAFSLVASALYVLNDVVDAERDSKHPVKRNRPIAAGHISAASALTVATAIAVVGFGISWLISMWLTATLAAYALLVLAYTLFLKHVPVADILAVALGFVLRAVAGAAATELPISSWFLIVTSGAALLVITGKRLAELGRMGSEQANSHRPALETYTQQYLVFVAGVAGAVAIVAYLLWAFDAHPQGSAAQVVMTVSAIPFVGALLRYALILHLGGGGEPEDIFLADRPIQLWAVAWLATFGAGLVIG